MTGLKGVCRGQQPGADVEASDRPPSFDKLRRRRGGTISPNFINSVRIAVPAAIISSLHRLDQRLHPVQVALPRLGDAVHADPVRDVHPLPGDPDPAVPGRCSGLGLYGSIEGLVIAHVIYGIPITTLIFRNYYVGHPRGADRGGEGRRRELLRHLPPHPAAAVGARLRGRPDLAVHFGLERVPVRQPADETIATGRSRSP